MENYDYLHLQGPRTGQQGYHEVTVVSRVCHLVVTLLPCPLPRMWESPPTMPMKVQGGCLIVFSWRMTSSVVVSLRHPVPWLRGQRTWWDGEQQDQRDIPHCPWNPQWLVGSKSRTFRRDLFIKSVTEEGDVAEMNGGGGGDGSAEGAVSGDMDTNLE